MYSVVVVSVQISSSHQLHPPHISSSSTLSSQSLSIPSHTSSVGSPTSAVHSPSCKLPSTQVVVIVHAAKHAPTPALQSCTIVRSSSTSSSQSLSIPSHTSGVGTHKTTGHPVSSTTHPCSGQRSEQSFTPSSSLSVLKKANPNVSLESFTVLKLKSIVVASVSVTISQPKCPGNVSNQTGSGKLVSIDGKVAP